MWHFCYAIILLNLGHRSENHAGTVVLACRRRAHSSVGDIIFSGIVRYMRLNRQTWQIRYMTETTNEIAPVKIDAD